jgi:MoaA/NifB/PqqE/SkfB family radical SAM enzyme
LKPIVEGISEMFPGMRLVILTNGTVHRIETLRFLANHNVAYQVSLDGPDASRHDCVRGEGSFDKSLKGIKTLQGFGAEVSILSILSSRTKPWIAEFFALAKALEVDSQNFTRLIAQGNGKMLVDKQADRPLSGPELKEALESILINSVVSGVATNTNQPLYALIDERVGQSGYFGFDALVIDYKGNLKATSRADLIIGNVLERTIEDLFLNNPILRKVRSGIIDVCGKCELYDRCGGDRNAAYAEFGDFTARDPGCWK